MVNAVYSSLSFRAYEPIQQAKDAVEVSVCPHCGKEIDQPIIKNTIPSNESNISGSFSSAKDTFIGVRKFFIDVTYLTAGTIKGAVYGGLAGGAITGIAAIRNIIKRAPKTLTTGNKILAGAVALSFMTAALISAKLDSNEKKAKLDHRWETGHNG